MSARDRPPLPLVVLLRHELVRALAHLAEAAGIIVVMTMFACLPIEWASALGGFIGRTAAFDGWRRHSYLSAAGIVIAICFAIGCALIIFIPLHH